MQKSGLSPNEIDLTPAKLLKAMAGAIDVNQLLCTCTDLIKLTRRSLPHTTLSGPKEGPVN